MGTVRIARKILSIAVLGLLPLNFAEAAIISASSTGYGLDAQISALGLDLDAGPLPTGATGNAPGPYNADETEINVSVTGDIPLVVGGAIAADAVNGTAMSDVDGLPGARSVSATGGVVGADFDVNTLPVIGEGVTLLGLDGTLASSAHITGDFGSLAATGMTTIESLNLTINGIAVDLSAFVGVNVAPNTSINLAVLGIANSTLILNEQIIAPDNSSIVVNALRLSVNLVNLITADVTLGHSEAQLTAVPEPASSLLILSACSTALCLRRRARTQLS